MRFLVTGGCGFIGSAVVRTLVERGERVLNIDRRRRAPAQPALAAVQGREGYARLEADISDRTLMRAIFREFQPDRVIHLAGSREEVGEALFDAEIGGAFAMLEASRALLGRMEPAARERFRIVHASDAHYGEPWGDREPADDAPGDMKSARDAVRAAAATFVEGWARGHSLPLVSCVADHVFGPWQPDTQLLPALITSVLAEREFTLDAAGQSMRDWLPVRDFADGLILASTAGAPLGRYEFSVGAERRDIDIAEAACALLGERRPRAAGSYAALVRCEGAAAQATSAAMLDPTEAEQELGWSPQGFHAGLDRAISWSLGRHAAARAAPRTLAAE